MCGIMAIILLLLGRELCGIVEKERRKRGREEDIVCKADKEEAGGEQLGEVNAAIGCSWASETAEELG